jgi:hypothetical protein
LGLRGTSIVEGWRSMREELLRHQVITLQNRGDVSAMDTDTDTHKHVLRALNNMLVDGKQVGSFESFEAEVVITVIPIVDDGRVKHVCVFLHDGVEVFRHQRGGLTGLGVDVVVQGFNYIGEDL